MALKKLQYCIYGTNDLNVLNKGYDSRASFNTVRDDSFWLQVWLSAHEGYTQATKGQETHSRTESATHPILFDFFAQNKQRLFRDSTFSDREMIEDNFTQHINTLRHAMIWPIITSITWFNDGPQRWLGCQPTDSVPHLITSIYNLMYITINSKGLYLLCLFGNTFLCYFPKLNNQLIIAVILENGSKYL